MDKKPNKKMSTEEWIERFKEVHGDRYDYSNVVYRDEQKRVPVRMLTLDRIENA